MRVAMRILAFVVLSLPLLAMSAYSADKPDSKSKGIVIKEEIVKNCRGFPYAPTIAVDAKLASLDDMKNTRAAVEFYLKEVDDYQKCLVALSEKLGDKLSPRDSNYLAMVHDRVQEERDVLAIDFNKLVDEYNVANGVVPKAPKTTAKTQPEAKTVSKPAAAVKPAATAKPATATPN
jgi:hypothetical protein